MDKKIERLTKIDGQTGGKGKADRKTDPYIL